MKKIFNNKIILIFELVILIVLLFSCNKYAVSNMLDKGNEFIANEDKEYIPIHQNAEIQEKFNVYAQYILIDECNLIGIIANSDGYLYFT